MRLKGKAAYHITTGLYFIIGVLALVFTWISVVTQPNLILFLTSVGGSYVAFDNVTCKSRKACYLN